ncbi:hypothetical protein DL762_006805 [Monosporascus cannonballus]|uniref:Nephrocystin 3-like N-terminal domain-containing protein n=1 Tax=Monosporascus cannonballus TaxID=155416 RepID=A0ABY0H5K7_9PEZI|nr:hypothetical protein DL762_006805 [Monosporascus cannonballus]
MSIVVDELMARFGNDKDTGIAYIYCSFRRQDKQKAEDLFASLLKQLAQGRSSPPDSLKSLHNKFLLARLYVDSLKGKRSPKVIRAALKNLATGSGAYDRAYNDVMRRIEELQHALAVEVGEPELDQENLTCIQDIISVTGLHLAAYFGDYEAVKVLPRGEDVGLKDSNLRTPLSFAAEYGHEAVVQLLLEKGADIESKDNSGWTPLWAAARYGQEAVVKLLLGKGADIESKDNERGQTPLFQAAARGHADVVRLLLDGGADVNSKDNDGQTPLSWAAQSGYEAIVKQLQSKA